MFCNQCGAKLADGSRFCQNCGAPIYDANIESDIDLSEPLSPEFKAEAVAADITAVASDTVNSVSNKENEAANNFSEAVSSSAVQPPVFPDAGVQPVDTAEEGSSDIGQTMLLSENALNESETADTSDSSFGQTAILTENSSENYSAPTAQSFPDKTAAIPPVQQNFPFTQADNLPQQGVNDNQAGFFDNRGFPSNTAAFPTQQNINSGTQNFQNSQGFPSAGQYYNNANNAPAPQGFDNSGFPNNTAANNTYPNAAANNTYPQPNSQPSAQFAAQNNSFGGAAGGFVQPNADAAYNAYAVPAPVSGKKKRKQAGMGATAALSVIFGIFVFVFLLSGQILIAARKTVSEGGLSKAIVNSNPSEVKVGSFAKSDSMKKILENVDVDIDEIDEDTTLSELIPKLFVDTDVNPDDVEAMFNETDILDILTSITGNYEEYLLTGETSSEIDVDSIMVQIKSHNSDFKKYLNVDIYDYTDSIEAGLNEAKDDIENLNPENALGGMGDVLTVALNPGVIVSVFVMAVIMALLIFLITNRFKPAMLTFGVGCFLSGLIMAIVSLFNSGLISLIADLDSNIAQYISSILNASFFDFALIIALIVAGVGLLLIVIRIIMAASAKSKNKKAQPQHLQQPV